MQNILIIGINNLIGKQLVSDLLKEKYQLKILADDNKFCDTVSSADILPIELTDSKNIDLTLFTKVDSIIICLDNNSDYLNENFGQTNFTFDQLNNLLKALSNLSQNTEQTLFDFTNSRSNFQSDWGAVDDVVMGGVSQSNFYLTDNQAVFTGYVSTDNNGGFASVRTRNFAPPLDLSQFEGIELHIQGDGKRYKFITRCEGQWDGISYCHSFDTIYNFSQTIRIPFQELIPVFRAKTVQEASKFVSSQVYSFQLMLSKFEYDGELNSRFEAGKFQLAVKSIKAYGYLNKPKLIVINTEKNDLLETTIINHKLNYTMIRYDPISTMPTTQTFELQNLNINQNEQNELSLKHIVKLAIKALESPEISNQIWQIKF